MESSGDYQPQTILHYRGYANDGSHFSFWDGKSIYEIRYAELHTWVHWLRELGIAACKAAEVEYVPLYRATNHTTFTALREAGVSRDEAQAQARHRDPRTTEICDLDDDQRRRRALAPLDQLGARGR